MMGLPTPKMLDDNVRAVTRLWRTLRRRWRPDHQTIARRRGASNLGGAEMFRVCLAVAPARRHRRPSILDLGVAGVFVTNTFRLSFAADHSTPSFLRFRARGEGHSYPTTVEVHSSGLIEVLWNLTPVSSDSSGAVLDALDVLHPLHRLATASREGAYSHLVGMRKSRRLDWYFNVSPYITTRHTPLYWKDLHFPGERPAGRIQDQRPFAPAEGLATERLQNLAAHVPPAAVEGVALGELLLQNGFHGVQAAVDSTLSALAP